jgi:hypothetical protein
MLLLADFYFRNTSFHITFDPISYTTMEKYSDWENKKHEEGHSQGDEPGQM